MKRTHAHTPKAKAKATHKTKTKRNEKKNKQTNKTNKKKKTSDGQANKPKKITETNLKVCPECELCLQGSPWVIRGVHHEHCGDAREVFQHRQRQFLAVVSLFFGPHQHTRSVGDLHQVATFGTTLENIKNQSIAYQEFVHLQHEVSHDDFACCKRIVLNLRSSRRYRTHERALSDVW